MLKLQRWVISARDNSLVIQRITDNCPLNFTDKRWLTPPPPSPSRASIMEEKDHQVTNYPTKTFTMQSELENVWFYYDTSYGIHRLQLLTMIIFIFSLCLFHLSHQFIFFSWLQGLRGETGESGLVGATGDPVSHVWLISRYSNHQLIKDTGHAWELS